MSPVVHISWKINGLKPRSICVIMCRYASYNIVIHIVRPSIDIYIIYIYTAGAALDPASGGEEKHLLAVAALHVQEEGREQACKYF